MVLVAIIILMKSPKSMVTQKVLLQNIYNGSLKSSSYGKSHKKAEKNAARKLIDEFINKGNF